MRIPHKLAVIILLFATFNNFAQEKLKGNKIVTTEDRAISDFTTIEVIDNVTVFLIYNENQSVAVEADSNLQSNLLTEVNNGVLTIRTNEIIGRSKALNIHLKVNKNLQVINAYNNAKVSSDNTLKIDNLIIGSFDNASIDLKLNSLTTEIHGVNSSKLNFEILSEDVIIRLEETTGLKGTIDTQEIEIISTGKSGIQLKGTTDILEMECSGNSSFKGKDFVSKQAKITASNSASVYIHVTENLELFSNNSSELHLYGNPEIVIHEFFDKALIRKRELD